MTFNEDFPHKQQAFLYGEVLIASIPEAEHSGSARRVPAECGGIYLR